jgi:hypothetical protein
MEMQSAEYLHPHLHNSGIHNCMRGYDATCAKTKCPANNLQRQAILLMRALCSCSCRVALLLEACIVFAALAECAARAIIFIFASGTRAPMNVILAIVQQQRRCMLKHSKCIQLELNDLNY